jgi:hypothetical protein
VTFSASESNERLEERLREYREELLEIEILMSNRKFRHSRLRSEIDEIYDELIRRKALREQRGDP